MAAPLLVPIAIGAGFFGLGALGGSQQKPRMAGEGPGAKGEMAPGTAYLDEKGELKVWGGPNYGPQSVAAWEKMTGQRVTGLEQAQTKGTLPPIEKAPPLEVPPAPPLPPPTNFPETSAEAQKTIDPNLEAILDVLKGRTSSESINELEEARLDRLIRAQQALSEQSYQKGLEISRRQAELERLKQWGAVEQTRIAANLANTALVGQAMYLSAVPNVSVMDAMTKGTQAALAPFQFKLGVRG